MVPGLLIARCGVTERQEAQCETWCPYTISRRGPYMKEKRVKKGEPAKGQKDG